MCYEITTGLVLVWTKSAHHALVNRDVCVFITAVPITKLFECVYYCSTYYKGVRVGGRGIVEDMCYERRRAEACVH